MCVCVRVKIVKQQATKTAPTTVSVRMTITTITIIITMPVIVGAIGRTTLAATTRRKITCARSHANIYYHFPRELFFVWVFTLKLRL